VPRQHVGVGAAGDHFAVDQHAVAIENDKLDARIQWRLNAAVLSRFVVVERNAI
jgi:hypothetical protein